MVVTAQMTYFIELSKRGEHNETWQYVTDRNKTWTVSVARREARVSPGNLQCYEAVLRSATFSSRLAADALGELYVLSGFATISHGPHAELRGTLAVSSRLIMISSGVLRFT